MRPPKMTPGPVCPWLSRLLSGVGACFILMGTGERLPAWTIHKSSVESVWYVDRIFLYRVYIDSNHRDSRI
jgi:hypothetical protein